MDDFESKWRKILLNIPNERDYIHIASSCGWETLPTSELPEEAQVDIDKNEHLVTGDVLVINHGLCGYLNLDGTMNPIPTQIDQDYLDTLNRILGGKDSQKVSTVFYDYPEHYCLDSRQRMMDGDIDSVILTPFNRGGAIDPIYSYQKIGENHTIYVGGMFLPCLSTTVEELYRNKNEIVIIQDAVRIDCNEDALDDVEIQTRISNYFDIDNLSFIKSSDFLKIKGI